VSVRYVPVTWTRSKMLYDAVLVVGVVLFLWAFDTAAQRAGAVTVPTDYGSLVIRVYGSCAFVLMTLVLAIGPLARLDRRFLPLLYNRRHFGVVTCVVALAHAYTVLDWYFNFSPTDPYVAMLAADAGDGRLATIPSVPFGVAALLILMVLAATSHDFWLKFLGPPLWKGLHMGIYAAYALVVAHVATGPLQSAQKPGFALVVVGGAALLVVLHLAAAWRGGPAPRAGIGHEGLIRVGDAGSIPNGRAVIIRPEDGEAVAVFNDDGRYSAVSHLCAHQNGPLGEGRIIDGCITCPWHGFQYRLVDGCAPAPFTERIATYRLVVDGETLLLDPRPNPPGTPVPPVSLPGRAA
jgi:hypothetical protein